MPLGTQHGTPPFIESRKNRRTRSEFNAENNAKHLSRKLQRKLWSPLPVVLERSLPHPPPVFAQSVTDYIGEPDALLTARAHQIPYRWPCGVFWIILFAVVIAIYRAQKQSQRGDWNLLEEGMKNNE